MQETPIVRFLADEPAVPFQAEDPFTRAYFEFLTFFERTSRIEPHHLIIGAHFTYGWMPTMLRMRSNDYAPAAATLGRAKVGMPLDDAQIEALAALVNNSLVGASKLLHFVNPRRYPIWDSRVYRYLHGGDYHPHLHKVVAYREFINVCEAISGHADFGPAHTSLNAKMGRPVTPFRAVEIVMYTAGARRPLAALQSEDTET